LRRRFIDQVIQLNGGLENGRPVCSVIYSTDAVGNAQHFQPDPQAMEELQQFAEVAR
jgi:hypothetical protein